MKIVRWITGAVFVVWLALWFWWIPSWPRLMPRMLPFALRRGISDSMKAPAALMAGGGERAPRVLWIRPFLKHPFPVDLLPPECGVRLDFAPRGGGGDGVYDLVMLDASPYFGAEAERMLLRDIFRLARSEGVVILPRRLARHLPLRFRERLSSIPGDESGKFAACLADGTKLPESDPEVLERRFCELSKDVRWVWRGIYPAIYPEPGRPLPTVAGERAPLLPFPPRILAVSAAAVLLLWLAVRLLLARRERTAWILCRGENAAAFGAELLCAGELAFQLEYTTGFTPLDLLPLLPCFWFAPRLLSSRFVPWFAFVSAFLPFAACLVPGVAELGGGAFLLLFALGCLVTSAAERSVLRRDRPLPVLTELAAEAAGFAVAASLRILLAGQPSVPLFLLLASFAAVFRLAACRDFYAR